MKGSSRALVCCMGRRIIVESTSSRFKRIGFGKLDVAAAPPPNLLLILLTLAGEVHLPMEPWLTFASSLLLRRWGSKKSLFFFCSCELLAIDADTAELLLSVEPFEASAALSTSFCSTTASLYIVMPVHVGESCKESLGFLASTWLGRPIPSSITLSRSICLSTSSITM